MSLRRLGCPHDEIRTICDAVRQAVATDRMATEPEFAKWINNEVAIGLMMKLSKTSTFDMTVSDLSQ